MTLYFLSFMLTPRTWSNAWEWTQGPKKLVFKVRKGSRPWIQCVSCLSRNDLSFPLVYARSSTCMCMSMQCQHCMYQLFKHVTLKSLLRILEAFYTWLFFLGHKLYTSHSLNWVGQCWALWRRHDRKISLAPICHLAPCSSCSLVWGMS